MCLSQCMVFIHSLYGIMYSRTSHSDNFDSPLKSMLSTIVNTKQATFVQTVLSVCKLEVLIEKGSAAISCELQIGQRQFVEQLNI